VLGMAQGSAGVATRRETGANASKTREDPRSWVLPGLLQPRVRKLHNFATVRFENRWSVVRWSPRQSTVLKGEDKK